MDNLKIAPSTLLVLAVAMHAVGVKADCESTESAINRDCTQMAGILWTNDALCSQAKSFASCANAIRSSDPTCSTLPLFTQGIMDSDEYLCTDSNALPVLRNNFQCAYLNMSPTMNSCFNTTGIGLIVNNYPGICSFYSKLVWRCIYYGMKSQCGSDVATVIATYLYKFQRPSLSHTLQSMPGGCNFDSGNIIPTGTGGGASAGAGAGTMYASMTSHITVMLIIVLVSLLATYQ